MISLILSVLRLLLWCGFMIMLCLIAFDARKELKKKLELVDLQIVDKNLEQPKDGD